MNKASTSKRTKLRSSEGIDVDVDGVGGVGVATIWLNRPAKLNAMTHEMMDALPGVLRVLSADPTVRCIVLGGRGTAFTAGGDLSTAMGIASVPDAELLARMNRRHEAAELLHEMNTPTIAMVQGVAAGAGMALALACDIVVAGESARFVSAFAHVGFSGDYGGSWTLQRLIGPGRARELYFTGGTLDAAEAARLGAVTRLVPDGRLEDETMALARKIAAGPPLALRRMKANMNLALTHDFSTVLRAEAESTVQMMRTEDNKNALQAFVDKRKPTFEGR